MVQSNEYVTGFSYLNRFIDGIDIQADGPAGDKVFLKWFDEEKRALELTYTEFRYCIYSVAHKFKEIINPSAYQKQTHKAIPIGFLSLSNVDSAINQWSLIYLNLTPILLSPRNTVEATINLLKQAGTKVLIYDEANKGTAESCKLVISDLQLIPKEKFNINLIKNSSPPTSVTKSQGTEHIVNIMHTSGTTSLPKLIYLSNRYYMKVIERLHTNVDTSPLIKGTVFHMGPMFHIYGEAGLWRFFYNKCTVVIGSAECNFSPRRLIEECKQTNSDFLALLPFHIKSLTDYCQANPREMGWDLLKKVEYIHFGGAHLAPSVVEMLINEGIFLVNAFGATELGLIATSVYRSTSDNHRAVKLLKDMQYEIVNRKGDTGQLLFYPSEMTLATGLCHTGGKGYLSEDLIKIINHDKAADVLEFELLGREDDIIVHISGEKTNLIAIEEIIESCTFVKKCAVIGSGRINNCILIQLNQKEASESSSQDILQVIRAHIDLANKESPNYSRIDYSLVYLLPLDTKKPLPLTPKGSIIRSKVAEVFSEEIDKLYSDYESLNSIKVANLDDNTDITKPSIIKFIKALFREIVRRDINTKESLFVQGIDSLNAVKFTNILKVTYPKTDISINVIYEKDTLEQLTEYIYSKSQGIEVNKRTLDSHQNEVDSLIKEFTKHPPKVNNEAAPSSKQEKLNVLVTGANGSLGSFIIKSLLHRDDIGKVYGLARASNNTSALEKIKSSFLHRKIVLSEPQWARFKGFAYVPEDIKLGLTQDEYDLLFDSVDIIYHVAWRMDFLKGVKHFRDCIESTVNLLKISALSPQRPAFHFTSTIGAAFPANTSQLISESQLKPQLINIEACNGYNLSKLVAETICLNWMNKFGFSLDIHRVGQVSGDTINGAWNVREHASLLIKSAQVMSMIPESYMLSVSWIPVDIAAEAMVEINFAANNPHSGTINHISNPQSIPWKQVISILQDLGIECKPVSSKTFLEALRFIPDYQDVKVNPLASLTDFSSNILNLGEAIDINLDVKLTSMRSPSICTCIPIDSNLLSKYINYWVSIGFLSPINKD